MTHHQSSQQQQPIDSYLNNYPLVYQVFNLPTTVKNEQEAELHAAGGIYQRNYQYHQSYYEDPSAPFFITEAESVSVVVSSNQGAGVEDHKNNDK